MTFEEFTIHPVPTDPRFQNLTNKRFDRLIVQSYAGQRSSGRQSQWNCVCDCGKRAVVGGYCLTQGLTRSCGCLHHELLSIRNTIHGEKSRTRVSPEYVAYQHAKSRCKCPTNKDYKYYGERGIEFRFNDFKEFLAEVGRKPTPNHSIDRIDNNGHYEKGNLRWATRKQQSQNRRNSKQADSLGNMRAEKK